MCCGHKQMLASFPGLRVNWRAKKELFYQIIYMKWMQKSVRKKNEGRRGKRDA